MKTSPFILNHKPSAKSVKKNTTVSQFKNLTGYCGDSNVKHKNTFDDKVNECLSQINPNSLKNTTIIDNNLMSLDYASEVESNIKQLQTKHLVPSLVLSKLSHYHTDLMNLNHSKSFFNQISQKHTQKSKNLSLSSSSSSCQHQQPKKQIASCKNLTITSTPYKSPTFSGKQNVKSLDISTNSLLLNKTNNNRMNISEIIESSFDLNEDDITENVPLKKPTFNSQHCYSETSNSEDHFGFKQIKQNSLKKGQKPLKINTSNNNCLQNNHQNRLKTSKSNTLSQIQFKTKYINSANKSHFKQNKINNTCSTPKHSNHSKHMSNSNIQSIPSSSVNNYINQIESQANLVQQQSNQIIQYQHQLQQNAITFQMLIKESQQTYKQPYFQQSQQLFLDQTNNQPHPNLFFQQSPPLFEEEPVQSHCHNKTNSEHFISSNDSSFITNLQGIKRQSSSRRKWAIEKRTKTQNELSADKGYLSQYDREVSKFLSPTQQFQMQNSSEKIQSQQSLNLKKSVKFDVFWKKSYNNKENEEHFGNQQNNNKLNQNIKGKSDILNKNTFIDASTTFNTDYERSLEGILSVNKTDLHNKLQNNKLVQQKVIDLRNLSQNLSKEDLVAIRKDSMKPKHQQILNKSNKMQINHHTHSSSLLPIQPSDNNSLSNLPPFHQNSQKISNIQTVPFKQLDNIIDSHSLLNKSEITSQHQFITEYKQQSPPHQSNKITKTSENDILFRLFCQSR